MGRDRVETELGVRALAVVILELDEAISAAKEHD